MGGGLPIFFAAIISPAAEVPAFCRRKFVYFSSGDGAAELQWRCAPHLVGTGTNIPFDPQQGKCFVPAIAHGLSPITFPIAWRLQPFVLYAELSGGASGWAALLLREKRWGILLSVLAADLGDALDGSLQSSQLFHFGLNHFQYGRRAELHAERTDILFHIQCIQHTEPSYVRQILGESRRRSVMQRKNFHPDQVAERWKS